eukprot:m.30486 g.30486  ORF g.30486 m.30486 type:complete len:579 (+) comp31347_c0_seq1:69-1805(+)
MQWTFQTNGFFHFRLLFRNCVCLTLHELLQNRTVPYLRCIGDAVQKEKKIVYEGTDLILRCGTDKVSWEQNGFPIAKRWRINEDANGDLRIVSASIYHNANYTCLKNFPLKIFDVRVVTPLLRAERGAVSVPEGERAVISCAASGLLPPVIWFFNGTKISSNEEISLLRDKTTSKLLLREAQLKNQGNYTCKGFFPGFSVKEDWVYVQIMKRFQPPKIGPIPGEFKLAPGENITVNCNASGYPPPLIGWRIPNGTDLRRSNLTIRNFTTAEEGIYKCHAWNSERSEGFVEKETKIFMAGPPLSPYNVSITFTCFVGLNITWNAGRAEYTNHSDQTHFNVTILLSNITKRTTHTTTVSYLVPKDKQFFLYSQTRLCLDCTVYMAEVQAVHWWGRLRSNVAKTVAYSYSSDFGEKKKKDLCPQSRNLSLLFSRSLSVPYVQIRLILNNCSCKQTTKKSDFERKLLLPLLQSFISQISPDVLLLESNKAIVLSKSGGQAFVVAYRARLPRTTSVEKLSRILQSSKTLSLRNVKVGPCFYVIDPICSAVYWDGISSQCMTKELKSYYRSIGCLVLKALFIPG